MLSAAFALIVLAVLLGSVLAIPHARGGRPPPWQPGAVHAALGLAGLACLIAALQGPPRGLDQGTGSFGTIAAICFGLAALLGAAIVLRCRVRRRSAGTLVGVHATLAITGFVILAAYLFS